jgi:hypothetical protein
MPFREIGRNTDAEKASGRQEVKLNNVERKKETSQQREDRNLRFYREIKESQIEEHRQLEVAKHEKSSSPSLSDWVEQVSDKASRMVSFIMEKKSAIGVSMMLAFAGKLSGAEGRFLGESTALRHLNGSNATSLHPLVEWKEFNNFSHPTAQKFNPNKVTPELLEHLSKFVKNPELFTQNMQHLDQRQKEQWLAKKAQANPDVLESLSNLFEEMPGKESGETPQSPTETHQGE